MSCHVLHVVVYSVKCNVSVALFLCCAVAQLVQAAVFVSTDYPPEARALLDSCMAAVADTICWLNGCVGELDTPAVEVEAAAVLQVRACAQLVAPGVEYPTNRRFILADHCGQINCILGLYLTLVCLGSQKTT
jgi:hypothetical protein